jgi:hypothetical protein
MRLRILTTITLTDRQTIEMDSDALPRFPRVLSSEHEVRS